MTNEKYPRVNVTRRILKDGANYYGPYFPGNLAHRLVHFIHRHFKVPSCKIDFSRRHTHPCLQYHIHRCLGPCVAGLTTDEAYGSAVRDVRLFLEGRHRDLAEELEKRMGEAADDMRFEEAANLRNLAATVREMEQKQKMDAAQGENIDIFAYHAEPPLVAVNLFHMRNGKVLDRRDFFWEDQADFNPSELVGALLKQVYLNSKYIPGIIHVPADFEDREELEDFLTELRGRKVEIVTPQRGAKKALLDLVEMNAKNSFDQRFRTLKPSSKAIGEALQDALNLPEAPRRIECFDISHIQGTDKVASMVVWEDGKMKKSDYRKFIIRTVVGNDDFASMREVVTRRYSRLQEEKKAFPGLILIDGGLGQLHAAAGALEEIGVTLQPLASIAKREEWIYVYGQEEDPIILDRFSPILHLDSDHPRRSPPLRRYFPPHSPERTAPDFGTAQRPRHRGKNRREAPENFRQFRPCQASQRKRLGRRCWEVVYRKTPGVLRCRQNTVPSHPDRLANSARLTTLGRAGRRAHRVIPLP